MIPYCFNPTMRNRYLVIIALLSTSLFLSCDPGQATRKSSAAGAASPGGEGAYFLEVTPQEIVRGSAVGLIATGFDLSKATVVWLVNGRPLEGETGPQLSLAALEKGDAIRARAFFDGQEIQSDEIEIMNSPPVIAKVDVNPESNSAGGTIRVEPVGQDMDNDIVTFIFEWTKNGKPAGSGSSIEGPLKRGDEVTVKITPFDGTDHGESMVIRREIGNRRPMITAHREFSFDGSIYTYQVRASDPDGAGVFHQLGTCGNVHRSEHRVSQVDSSERIQGHTVPVSYCNGQRRLLCGIFIRFYYPVSAPLQG